VIDETSFRDTPSPICFAGVRQHLIQRGNNRQATFFAEEDYRCHLGWPLGGECFKDEIERALKRATRPPR
jgi:hypothetical protein